MCYIRKGRSGYDRTIEKHLSPFLNNTIYNFTHLPKALSCSNKDKKAPPPSGQLWNKMKIIIINYNNIYFR